MMSAQPPPSVDSDPSRIGMLDGWRAVSILLVLAGHMLPLGPKAWRLNESTATSGMSIFFTLSGFLIAGILIRNPSVPAFLAKRFARILPLAWLVLIVVLGLNSAARNEWLANLFFYANLPPFYLEDTGHFWSLCVEMQFYVSIAFAIAVFGRRGLWVTPVALLAVTAFRIAMGAQTSIVTWLRVDEILAGGVLALTFYAPQGEQFRRWLANVPFYAVLLLFLGSSHPDLGALNYARPYLSALMVGITLARPISGVAPVLSSSAAAYIAKVSYAVYLFHPYSTHGWLGSGIGIEKYLKRPISFALTFALAHASTFYFEGPINRWAHRLVSGNASKKTPRQ
jgi:peptidoglycan/LPS O-acetylase OafA/YrhL